MILIWQNGGTHSEAAMYFVEVPAEKMGETFAILTRGTVANGGCPRVLGTAEKITWLVRDDSDARTISLSDFATSIANGTNGEARHAKGCPCFAHYVADNTCTCWLHELVKLAQT